MTIIKINRSGPATEPNMIGTSLDFEALLFDPESSKSEILLL